MRGAQGGRAAGASRMGYFPIPNRLLAEGCGRPVALGVYAALASTPHIWAERGSLQPYQVRASRSDLVNATGANPKQVRGALAWLIRNGFVVRLDTPRKAKAAFQVVAGAKLNGATSPVTPTTSTTAPKPKGPRSPEKGQAKGQDGAKDKPLPDNELCDSPPVSRAKTGAKVFKEVEDKTTTTPPPSPPPQRGGILKMWHDAWDGSPPREPKATHPDSYRRTALERATAGETPEDIERMFSSWVAATDPDWGPRRSDGVGAFAAAVGLWIERRNIERADRERWATVPSLPGDRQLPGPLTDSRDDGGRRMKDHTTAQDWHDTGGVRCT